MPLSSVSTRRCFGFGFPETLPIGERSIPIVKIRIVIFRQLIFLLSPSTLYLSLTENFYLIISM